MPPRKTNSAYARKKSATADDHVDGVSNATTVQSKTYDTLSLQIADLTRTLVQTQKEAGEAKDAAAIVLASNSKLKKVVHEARSSAEDACSASAQLKLQLESQRQKRERPTSFTSKGNEQQADAMLDIVDDFVST
jgi:hypothetical protein